MRLKTFFVSYLAFLFILFSAITMISRSLLSNQMQILSEQSIREYQRITNTLIYEVEQVYERTESIFIINSLVESYVAFHEAHGIQIEIFRLNDSEESLTESVILFSTNEIGDYFNIRSEITTDAGRFSFEMQFDVTDELLTLRDLQRNLLILFIVFSVVAFIFLYTVMAKIFEPLQVVIKASQEIAEGDYTKRLQETDKDELGLMAQNFNKMAFEIEARIQLLEEASERKQQFIDNFAHEVRTPLTAIYGYAEYMKRATLNEKTKLKSTTYVMNEAKYLIDLANAMLELATLRDFQLQKEKISLTELFDQIAQTLQAKIVEQCIHFTTEASDCQIIGQSDLLKSLLLNLCTNAIKACEAGGGEVQLSAKEENEIVIITVSDNGCGIPEENLSKVTEPFYSMSTARNRTQGGVGLGLALCQQIAQLHAAEMTIASVLGSGTTVTIDFTTS